MDQGLDLGRHRGREEERVPDRRHLGEHEFDLVDEAHVEHAVGFVEYDRRIFREVQALAVDEVAQAAGRADQEIRPVRERFHLCHDRRAADGADCAQGHASREAAELVLDLLCQLASRHDDQDLLEWPLQDLVDERHEEGRSLAGASVGDADDVLALKHVRDGLVLDRRRHDVFLCDDRSLEPSVDSEVVKCMLRHIGRGRHRRDYGFVDESRRIDIHARIGELGTIATIEIRPASK